MKCVRFAARPQFGPLHFRQAGHGFRELFSAACPHCKSVDIRPVGERNAVEKALHWVLLPYRCSLCGKHLFLFRWSLPAD